MFLPLDRKPDWKNPPLVTISLVLINVLLFYMWQHGDIKNEREAMEYYMYSELYKVESEQYLNFREKKTELTERDYQRFTPKAQKVLTELFTDAKFQQKLEADALLKPGDEGYNDWRSKRNKFVSLRNRVVANKYGLKASQPTALTFLTNMFLHGSTSHLVGNMVFLFLMGFVVEMVLGRLVYFLGYMFAGLTGGLLYVALFSDQANGTIGASGAVAGIMGMYLVLFGLRKIRFFYFLFVYFDYVKAPAIIILPFYILYQLFIQFGLNTNINVSAHIGGLLGGAIVALIAKRFQGSMNTEYMDEEVNKEKYQQDLDAAQQLLATMKIDEAREKFEALLMQYPNDITVKQQLFTIAKYNPASEPYHQYAHQLLNLAGSDKTTVKIIHDTFTEYAAKAKPKPRWTPELLITIAVKFATCGYLDDAEKLVNYLIKAKKDFPRNAEGLSALAKYYNGIDKQKVIHYQQLLLLLYPDSAEAVHAQHVQTAGTGTTDGLKPVSDPALITK